MTSVDDSILVSDDGSELLIVDPDGYWMGALTRLSLDELREYAAQTVAGHELDAADLHMYHLDR